jgi:sugar lactone lactonase YvrE
MKACRGGVIMKCSAPALQPIQPGRFLLVLLVLLLCAPSILFSQSAPDKVLVRHHNLFPEGIEYDEQGKQFLLSSATEGTIYAIRDDGTAIPFIEDPVLKCTLGIQIDWTNNRLLVVNIDGSLEPDKYTGTAACWLFSYDLVTRKRIFMANLSELSPELPKHSANDVAVDSQGNAYVTDTLAAMVYRVDITGKATIHIKSSTFSGLNGIVAHPDGYLLLGSAPRRLFKLIFEKPAYTQVKLPVEMKHNIVDGMLILPDGDLVIVVFPGDYVYQLHTDDDWATSTLVAKSQTQSAGWATTITYRDGCIYTIYSHLDCLQEGTGDQEVFEIVKIVF